MVSFSFGSLCAFSNRWQIVMTYGSFIDDGFDGIKVLDLLLMAFVVLFVIGGIFYFSKLKTDLWSLALFVLGVDILVLINAMIHLWRLAFLMRGCQLSV